MVIVERRVVTQNWYEIECTKTGWDSHGWLFDCGAEVDDSWTVVYIIHLDKFGNPISAVVERESHF